MSRYTMTLREYVEMYSQNDGTLSTAQKIENARTKLFDFEYPIFDTNYKKDFETHFIRNFYMREIGFETEGLFKFYLETWLLINMPYWNKMYQSESITFDPLSNSKTDVTHTKSNDKTLSGNSSSTDSSSGNSSITEDDFNRNLTSDTPDTRLAITTNDGQGVIEHASSIDEFNANNSKNATSSNSGNSSTTASSTENDSENFTQHSEGKIGVQSFSKMLNEYRDTFLRIDKMIFDEMNELFMLVY